MTTSVIAAGADIIFGQGNGSSFGMLQAVETNKAVDGSDVLFIDVIGDQVGAGYRAPAVLGRLGHDAGLCLDDRGSAGR